MRTSTRCNGQSELSVGKAARASNTSQPETIFPKTVCSPSKCGAPPPLSIELSALPNRSVPSHSPAGTTPQRTLCGPLRGRNHTMRTVCPDSLDMSVPWPMRRGNATDYPAIQPEAYAYQSASVVLALHLHPSSLLAQQTPAQSGPFRLDCNIRASLCNENSPHAMGHHRIIRPRYRPILFASSRTVPGVFHANPSKMPRNWHWSNLEK